MDGVFLEELRECAIDGRAGELRVCVGDVVYIKSEVIGERQEVVLERVNLRAGGFTLDEHSVSVSLLCVEVTILCVVGEDVDIADVLGVFIRLNQDDRIGAAGESYRSHRALARIRVGVSFFGFWGPCYEDERVASFFGDFLDANHPIRDSLSIADFPTRDYTNEPFHEEHRRAWITSESLFNDSIDRKSHCRELSRA